MLMPRGESGGGRRCWRPIYFRPVNDSVFFFFYEKRIRSFWNESAATWINLAGMYHCCRLENDCERTKHSGVPLVAPSRESFGAL